MKTFKNLLFILIAILILHSCKSVKNAKNLQDCKFAFESVTDIKVGNLVLDNKKSFKDLSPTETIQLSQMVMSKKLPISLVTNISINNPNSKKAGIQALDWIIELEGKELASGNIDQKIEIKPHETISIPIAVETDLGKLMQSYNIQELSKLLFSFTNSKNLPQNITLKVKPSISIGKKHIHTPGYFPINIAK